MTTKPEVTQLLHEYRADLMSMRYPDNDEGDYLVRERDATIRRIARAIANHEAAMAGTEPKGSYQRGYDDGRNQGTRHRVADIEQLEAARAADKARIAELIEALKSMTCAYRMAIQAGHARITALGGDCDSVDRMLADFPDYGRSVELYKSCRAALAQQGKENEP